MQSSLGMNVKAMRNGVFRYEQQGGLLSPDLGKIS